MNALQRVIKAYLKPHRVANEYRAAVMLLGSAHKRLLEVRQERDAANKRYEELRESLGALPAPSCAACRYYKQWTLGNMRWCKECRGFSMWEERA